MNKKILLLTSGVKNIDVLNQGINYVKAKTLTIGLNLDFTIVVTNTKFTSIVNPVGDLSVGGYDIDPQQIIQDAKKFNIPFDIACLVFDWTLESPQPTNPTCGGIAIQIPEQFYGGYPNVFGDFFLHELSHFFYEGTGKQDLTHTYLPQFAQSTTRSDEYLFLIKSNMNLIPPVSGYKAPSVVLTRNTDNGIETIGTLVIGNNLFTCRTLERPFLNNQHNISCIPKGTYLCKWKFKFNSLAYHYELQNVPNRDGIFIHPGNYFFNSMGCILLGNLPQDINKDGQTDVINSKLTVSAFEKLLGKKDFTIIIQ